MLIGGKEYKTGQRIKVINAKSIESRRATQRTLQKWNDKAIL